MITHHATVPRALISVHDLMPETLSQVRAILAELERLRRVPVTLLVVPGRAWNPAELATLRAFAHDGHRLAAHGWYHHSERFGGLGHRLHGALFSRRVAEHLALDEAGILALLRRSHAWFADHGFAAPRWYVPPAWALGSVPRARLATAAPFAYYELFNGWFEASSGRFLSLPLLGYEADRAIRAPLLRAWNRLNRARARYQPLVRIGIHPDDFNLRLAAELRADLTHYPPASAADETAAWQACRSQTA